MVKIIADNILSPLGETTRDNLLAVRDGRSRLQAHRLWQIPDPFVASLFDQGQERPTYEMLVLSSILRCLDVCTLSGRVVLVLSSTKGHTIGPDAHPFGESARRIERLIRPFLPKVESLTSLTVSNACVSGLSALIVARRLLEMGAYDYAIVAGCDVQSRFIVAGFQSFMAMSPEPCRPFDEDRCGLNLGEAAATIIFKRCSDDEDVSRQWVALPGYMRNDAYHISTPSRTAEGSYLALTAAMGHVASPLCISAHGTATLYNDEMEASAIHRASMGEVPVTALKGYFGHTMGAAGILESILTMHALQEGWIPATLGFNALGTSRPIHVINRHQPLSPQQKQHPSFIKMMSGFGGCNTAMGFEYLSDSKGDEGILGDIKGRMCSGGEAKLMEPAFSVRITSEGVTLCGEALPVDGAKGKSMLTALYRKYVGDYPKFYKMDLLSRLGFIAAELLFQKEGAHAAFDQSRAVLLFGQSASCVADRSFEATIQPGDNYFPSPADFVYTLPNIVLGEIAIRHQLHGETCYFALSERDDALIHQLVSQAFLDPATTSALYGWIDAPDDNHFVAELHIFNNL
ncbi:MAG: 3-oxoacyl-ACP synthase [Bacteroidales bacterium]|nr:3-oxoacyl-ACP synthase [Bacteroidales bacterium]